MRVINTETYEFKEVWSETDIEYAVLSHRWEEEEISFQEYQTIQVALDSDSISFSQLPQKNGFKKIESCCAQARHEKIKYVWIDTCCIDKTSSAELTEAINSMYRWYCNAKICYAFLSDVSCNLVHGMGKGSLASSTWFTRGWTLQELVAPQLVVFFDRDWEFIGTKQSLRTKISDITGIDEAILEGEDILNRSIAQRMSWASKRTTTRIEDIAYCLLGLFDVNIPLLYGEGPKAFLRLQEAIIQASDDHTIFAWPHQRPDETGLLAQSPAAFERCGGVRAIGSRGGKSSYSMTNRGLSITLYAQPWDLDTYLVALQCVDERLHRSTKNIERYRMVMFIRRLEEDDQFVRVQDGQKTFLQQEESAWEPHSLTNPSKRPALRRMEIKVRQTISPGDADCLKGRIYGFRLRMPELLDREKHETGLFAVANATFDPDNAIMLLFQGAHDAAGVINVTKQGKKIQAIKLGFDFDGNPVCFIADSDGLKNELHFRDRQGNFRPGNVWMWTAEEQAEFKGIFDRSCYDSTAWSVITADRALPLKQHHGLWAIKADRVHGLSVYVSTGDGTNLMVLDIRKAETGGKLLWDVSILGTKDVPARPQKPSLPTRRRADSSVKNSDDETGNTKRSMRLSILRRNKEE